MKRIIFPKQDGGVAIIIPSPNWGGGLNDLAKKDVPAGTPYLIVDALEIPEDRSRRGLWVADFSQPDGYGE